MAEANSSNPISNAPSSDSNSPEQDISQSLSVEPVSLSDTDGTSAATASSPAKSPLTPQEISDKIMERVHKAEEYKSAGNESYKGKDIKSAIGKYHRGLLFVKGLDSMAQQDVVQRLAGVGKSGEVFGSPGTQDFGEIIGKLLPDNIEERVAGIEQSCYNNLAACLLQQENPKYEKVVFYCDKVLLMEAANPKALFRKGQSLYHLRDYGAAVEVLKKARQNAKSDPNVRKYISLCEAQIADQDKKEKVRYKAMFDKLADEESAEGER